MARSEAWAPPFDPSFPCIDVRVYLHPAGLAHAAVRFLGLPLHRHG